MKSTSFESSADGVHREFWPSGILRKEFALKDGKLDGTEREWHDNGQLRSEVHCLAGIINGRMRIWSDDGVLITQQFFFDGRPISKKKYDGLCASWPSLPVYPREKIINTVGRAVARERKQRQNDLELQLRIRQGVDADCADYAQCPDTKEARAWARGRRGERGLGSLETTKTRRLVRKLYAVGAAKVWVANVEADPDGDEFGSRLIVKLPADAGKQGQIFDLLAESARPFLTGPPAVLVGLRFMAATMT